MPSDVIFLLPNALSDEGLELFNAKYYLAYYSSIKHYICENEKATRAFFKSIGTPVPQAELNLIALPKHDNDYSDVINFIEQNRNYPIGLISDAGVPCVGDPGNEVVKMAHKFGIEVRPLVGPCSMLMALMASGCNGQNFAFVGYLPIKNAEKEKRIKQLETLMLQQNQTQVFIETPYRSDQLLGSLVKILHPSLRLSVSIKLTSTEEKTISKTIEHWRKTSISIGKNPCVFVLGR